MRYDEDDAINSYVEKEYDDSFDIRLGAQEVLDAALEYLNGEDSHE